MFATVCSVDNKAALAAFGHALNKELMVDVIASAVIVVKASNNGLVYMHSIRHRL